MKKWVAKECQDNRVKLLVGMKTMSANKGITVPSGNAWVAYIELRCIDSGPILREEAKVLLSTKLIGQHEIYFPNDWVMVRSTVKVLGTNRLQGFSVLCHFGQIEQTDCLNYTHTYFVPPRMEIILGGDECK